MRYHFKEYNEHRALYDGIFGQANLPFAAITGLLTGQLLAKGRRPVMMLISVFSILGMLIYLIDNLWCIILGKVVMGIAFGMLQTAGGRILEEYVPPHLYGTMMMIYMFSQTISLMLSVIIASTFIPTDLNKLATSGFCRWYLVWPLPLTLVSLAGIFLFLRHEPPKYLISLGKQEEALESIKMIYHPDEDHQEILNYLKQTISTKTDSVTFKEALCEPRYSYALYVCVTWVVFITVNGSQSLGYYGAILLPLLQSGPDQYQANTILNYGLIA